MGFEKKKKAACAVIVLLSLLLAACAAVLLVRLFSPRVRYEVRVSDVLFERYVSGRQLEGLPFDVVRESDAPDESPSFFAPVTVTAASIRMERNLTLLPQNVEENETCYPLSQQFFLPCVPADFSSAGMSVLDPALSLSFREGLDIPDGWRALPVEGVYATEDDYELSSTVSAVVTTFVFDSGLEEALHRWCEEVFTFEEDPSLSSADGPVFIAGVGDIMMARGAQELLMSEGGLSRVFGTTLPLLQESGFTIGNLEGVVTDSWDNATKTYTFKFRKAVLPYLKEAGFDYLMQTNNHCYDYGESGFRDTLAAFREYGIPSSGVGYDEDEARRFYRTTVDGLPVSVISCGAFPVERSGFDGKKTATATADRAGILWQDDWILEAVRAEKDAGNVVVVNVHGGEEYRFTPTKAQRTFYEALCDSGADIVFGSHPHVLQPTEWHNGSLIVYSLGNFVFNGMEEMPGATDSEVVRVGFIGKKIAYVEQYPARLDGPCVTLR